MSNAKKNEILIRHAPELKHTMSYPIHYKLWIDPTGTGPIPIIPKEENGEESNLPSFIPSKKDTGPKPGYVFGKGKSPRGLGYHHLRTRTAYQILYNRMPKKSFFRPIKEETKIVTRILYDRSIAGLPRDEPGQASKCTLSGADTKAFSGAGGGVAF